ncbi:MAG: hypothetical protein IIB58_03850 [Planctomycetes bacterium]|nr:hypothetical protein [Planctomycetota bacterium]
MIELKQEVNLLSVELGLGERYDVSFDDADPVPPESVVAAPFENAQAAEEP